MLQTPRGERYHIGIFGRRNAGKSSLINALSNQKLALVSPVPGTTTDPVAKAMELLPLGPILLIDTAGLDDEGELGLKRVERSRREISNCDLLLITVAADREYNDLTLEDSLLQTAAQQQKPALLVLTKSDLPAGNARTAVQKLSEKTKTTVTAVSTESETTIDTLKKQIIRLAGDNDEFLRLAADLVPPGRCAVLVTPIDDAAPKGRLILPQVQTIRDILDNDGITLVVKERELAAAFKILNKPPAVVITDSQAFQKVSADTPPAIPLTSFSILFARYKGDLNAYISGIRKLKDLQNGDRILIAESCTHHVQSDDIGTVKIPRWIREATGKELHFEKKSGRDFPTDLNRYALIIQCGGCMLNRRAVNDRISSALNAGVPITNYGMVIAWSFGILERALQPFPLAISLLNGDIY